MTIFVRASNGNLVNADCVKRIVQHYHRADDTKNFVKKGDLSHYELVLRSDEGGSSLTVDPYDMPLKLLQHQIIPAAAGSRALIVCYDDRTDAKPTAEDVWPAWAPIIAWRIAELSRDLVGFPVFHEEPASNATVFIELPDGRLSLADSREFSGADEVKAYMLDCAQQSWEGHRERAGGASEKAAQAES
jgi:hypothetical protein